MNDRHVIRVQFCVRRRFAVVPWVPLFSQFSIQQYVLYDLATNCVVSSARKRNDNDQSTKRDVSSQDDGIVTLMVFSSRSPCDNCYEDFSFFYFYISQVLDHNVYVCL